MVLRWFFVFHNEVWYHAKSLVFNEVVKSKTVKDVVRGDPALSD